MIMITSRPTLLLLMLLTALLHINNAAAAPPPPAWSGDTVRVVIPRDFPPTYFQDSKTGKPSGFAVDIMNEVARTAGLKVEYIFGKPWQEIDEMILDGRADLVPNLAVNQARKELFSFTRPVETVAISLFALKSNTDITGLVAGLTVGTMRMSVGDTFMRGMRDLHVITYDSVHKMLFDLLAGQIDAALIAEPNLIKMAQDAGVDDKIKVVGSPVFELKRAMALRKNDGALFKRIDEAIKQVVGSPLYSELYKKWWSKPKPYWNTNLVMLVVGLAVLAVAIVMGGWRYATIKQMNSRLNDALNAAEFERSRTQAILDALNDGISIQDSEMRVIYQNPQQIEITGDHIGEFCYQAYQQKKNVCEGCPVWKTFTDGCSHVDIRSFEREGITRHFEIFSSPLRDKSDKIAFVIESIRDVTGRIEAEEALRDREFWLLESQRIGKIGSYVLDFTTGTWTSSAVLDELLGIETGYTKDIAGWEALIHPEYRNYLMRYFRKEVVGERKPFRAEFKVVRQCDNKERWVQGIGELVYDAEDKPTRITGTIQDITERKSTENMLQEQTKLLEQEVAVRQMAQEALVIKQQQLETLNEKLEERVFEELEKNRDKDRIMMHQGRLAAMGEMIGNIAHQWRQPLNNIGLLVQGILVDYEDGTLDAVSLQRQIDICMDSVQYMSRTIDDFRSFFRPDKEKRLFVVGDALTRVLSLVRANFANSGIKLMVEDGDAGIVLGYANEYSQALLNIVVNAKDALLERQTERPAIELRCYRSDDKSVVTVHDNAGGISDTLIDKIFDPYFTTKEKTQGTGIGLYMAKMIIEKNMGGSLTVRNTDKGAEFRIEVLLNLSQGMTYA